MQAFDVAFGFLPEPEGKMILLKKIAHFKHLKASKWNDLEAFSPMTI